MKTGSQKSIDEAVHLSLHTAVKLEKLATSDGCKFHAMQPETVAGLEDLVTDWCQQIEKVQ